jgi:hypothetical protein
MAEKDQRHGCGRSIAAGSSDIAPHGRGDRGRRDQYIEDEERLEVLGRTIDAIHHTERSKLAREGVNSLN